MKKAKTARSATKTARGHRERRSESVAALAGRPSWPARVTFVLAMTGLSYLLSLPIFEPNAVWPLAYVAFVPWLLAIAISPRTRGVYVASFALGLAFWLTHWRWMYAVSPLVYLTACLILGVYFALAAWPIRHLVRRRGLPLTLVFPVVWTAYELVHSRGTLASPWCLLAHSQARVTTMIQIADLVGAFGVSFVVALVNGLVADLLLHFLEAHHQRPSSARLKRLYVVTAATGLIVSSTIVYGRLRLNDDSIRPGPRVAVLQGDFLLRPGMDMNARVINARPPLDDELDRLVRAKGEAFNADKRIAYLALAEKAAHFSPDLFVLPESPWNMVLNREYRESPLMIDEAEPRLQHEQFVRLAEQYGVAIVVGGLTQMLEPPGSYPAMNEYNSAYVYRPGEAEPDRYDKIHLVLLGEYLPFRDSHRFYWVYRFLNDGFWNPWGHGGKEYVTTPGQEYKTFTVAARSQGGRPFRFAVPICYEDVISHVYRRFVLDSEGGKRVDFMLNISNVGWFGHGHQQAQHLAACTFRAVENRVGIARAVNTGISGFIRSDGGWHDLAGNAGADLRPGGVDFCVADVRIDPRVTLYSRYGDWWAWLCLLLSAVAVLDALVARSRDSRTGRNG